MNYLKTTKAGQTKLQSSLLCLERGTDPGSQLEEICESSWRSLFPLSWWLFTILHGVCSSNKPKHDLVAHYVSVLLLFKPRSNLLSNLSSNLWALLGMQLVIYRHLWSKLSILMHRPYLYKFNRLRQIRQSRLLLVEEDYSRVIYGAI